MEKTKEIDVNVINSNDFAMDYTRELENIAKQLERIADVLENSKSYSQR